MISDYLRLKKHQKKRLSEISEDLNRQRLDRKMSVIEDSKVLHEIIDAALEKIIIEEGNIKFK